MTPPSLKQPSAFLPVVLSLVGLAMVLVHAAVLGIVHEQDEGTMAHIFQLLMIAQIPFVGFFSIRWLPEEPRRGLTILALQGGAFLAAVAAVHFLT